MAAALAACAGGMVVLPSGHTFLLRPIELVSSTHLVVDGDIQAWGDVASWPNSTLRLCPVTPYESKTPVLVPKKESLLWTHNSTGVTLSGKGVIHGGGEVWWPYRNRPGDYWHNCRPSLVEFGCGQMCVGNVTVANTQLRVSGITLSNSPFWTFVLRGARDAWLDDVKVTTPPCDGGKNVGYGAAPNTDGFNIGASDGVLITNSYVRNRDDCVPLFPPIRNITVRNITCECGNGLVPCVWPRLSLPGHGGDIANVLFDNATFLRSSMAVAMKSLESFVGTVRNVTYANLKLVDVGQAIMVNVYGQNMANPPHAIHVPLSPNPRGPRREGAMPRVATYSDITIVNVSGTAASPGKMDCGSSAPCTGITMRNVRLTVPAGKEYLCANAHGTASDCSPVPCLQP